MDFVLELARVVEVHAYEKGVCSDKALHGVMELSTNSLCIYVATKLSKYLERNKNTILNK